MLDTDLAPIVLFVYNRPRHTHQTLEALMANELADKSRLIIYCDGPKQEASAEQLRSMAEVRKLVREKKWCSIVEIVEGETNKGLAASVIAGVTNVVNKYGKIIVLEDDLITAPYFLDFMNECLELYKAAENIYSVNAFMFPINWERAESVVLPFSSTWGWGTWSHRWGVFQFDMIQKGHITKNDFLANRFNIRGYPYTDLLEAGNNSWGIRWYYTVFIHNGLGVFPTRSLIHNIGFDGSGVNCNVDNALVFISQIPIKINGRTDIDLEFFSAFLNSLEPKGKKKKKVIRKLKNIFLKLIK